MAVENKTGGVINGKSMQIHLKVNIFPIWIDHHLKMLVQHLDLPLMVLLVDPPQEKLAAVEEVLRAALTSEQARCTYSLLGMRW